MTISPLLDCRGRRTDYYYDGVSNTNGVLSHHDIQETPGADRTYVLAMITDYVAAAYLAHARQAQASG
jgi:hypothetical protein